MPRLQLCDTRPQMIGVFRAAVGIRFEFFGEQFVATISEPEPPAMVEHAVQRGPASPCGEVRSGLKLLERSPQRDLGFLKNVLRVRIRQHAAHDTGGNRRIMQSQQLNKLLGPGSIRVRLVFLHTRIVPQSACLDTSVRRIRTKAANRKSGDWI
jgi:hypothetical protein